MTENKELIEVQKEEHAKIKELKSPELKRKGGVSQSNSYYSLVISTETGENTKTHSENKIYDR